MRKSKCITPPSSLSKKWYLLPTLNLFPHLWSPVRGMSLQSPSIVCVPSAVPEPEGKGTVVRWRGRKVTVSCNYSIFLCIALSFMQKHEGGAEAS